MSRDSTRFPESVYGTTPSPSQDGQQMPLFGPALAPANPSPRPGDTSAWLTSDTSGPIGSDSSVSALLQSCLENRLLAGLASSGSTLYRLTWKAWVMPSRRRICALRAWAPRTPGSGSFLPPRGWATPTCNDSTGSTHYGGGFLKLSGQARLVLRGWPTPAAQEAGGTAEQFLARKEKARRKGANLGASLTSCALVASLVDFGPMPNGDHTETAQSGRINPAHSLWLMGLPVEWLLCAPEDRTPTHTTVAARSMP